MLAKLDREFISAISIPKRRNNCIELFLVHDFFDVSLQREKDKDVVACFATTGNHGDRKPFNFIPIYHISILLQFLSSNGTTLFLLPLSSSILFHTVLSFLSVPQISRSSTPAPLLISSYAFDNFSLAIYIFGTVIKQRNGKDHD